MYITRRSTHTLHFIPLTNSFPPSKQEARKNPFPLPTFIPLTYVIPIAARVSILSRSKFHKRRNDRILLNPHRQNVSSIPRDGSTWYAGSSSNWESVLGKWGHVDHNRTTQGRVRGDRWRSIWRRIFLSGWFSRDEIYYYSFSFFFKLLELYASMLWTVASFEYIRSLYF